MKLRINTDNGIVWCDATANAWKGCVKTSEGCLRCWSERMMTNFGHTDEFTVENAENGNITPYINRRVHAADPLDRLDPQWVFLPSSSDPYLPWVPEQSRRALLEAVGTVDKHVYMALTKWGAEAANPHQDYEEFPPIPTIEKWPDHVILGVSCESPRRKYRLDWLRDQSATTKFVSFEPLVEPIEDVDLSGIDWIIVGGESHPDPEERRDMDPSWPVPLYEAAREQGVAFLFKQHSGTHAEADRRLDIGEETLHEFNEFPAVPDGLPPAPEEFVCSDCGTVTTHPYRADEDTPTYCYEHARERTIISPAE